MRTRRGFLLGRLPAGRWTSGTTEHHGASGVGTTVVRLTFVAAGSTTVLYLTDTASDVATASVDLEAWTSRGGGVVNKTTNSVAGWTAPVQMTYTAGGTAIDWFTKQLTAFTLTGMAVGSLWLQSQGAADASARCEIARVDSDGTNATVWASWCIAPTGTDNGELPTSPGAIRTFNISGDDLAISNGQRLRIRVYLDDKSNAPMVAAGAQAFIYYNGTSAAASGDTYITLPVSVTEVPVLEQEAYRFRNDDGSETSATWRQAVNTPDAIALDDFISPSLSRREYRRHLYRRLSSSVSQETECWRFWGMDDYDSFTHIAYSGLSSSHYTDLTATTQQISAGTFDAGIIREGVVQFTSSESSGRNNN